MLSVSSRFAPINRRSLVGHLFAVDCDVLAVAFHGQLLEVGWEPFHVLFVGKDRHGLGPEEIVVPNSQKTEEYGEVLFEGSGAKVFVHLMETVQQSAKMVRADGYHSREADGGGHGVATADPIPELKHVCGVYTELGDLLGIGGNRDKVFRDRIFVSSQAID